MSRSPYAVQAARWGQKMGDTKMIDMMTGALTCPFGTGHMGVTAENVAAEAGISRADQDAFALRSQQKAAEAKAAGYFAEEIVPVVIHSKHATSVIDTDEHPRAGSSLAALEQLKPVNGDGQTVTAGNASGLNDGASAMVLASADAVAKYGLTPRAKVLGMASGAVLPRVMGVGPLPAVRTLLARLDLSLHDFDVIELNEAFASQGLAILRELGLADDAPQVNPNGGAIALGHPLGMSGARLVLTALHQLEKTGGKKGLATMCVGVGQGLALAIERV